MQLTPKTATEEDKQLSTLDSGTYSVKLLKRIAADELEDSYQQTISRVKNLELKLQRNHELRKQYSFFITEYTDLKHMSPVDIIFNHVPLNFLSHHCVFKVNSTKTKPRMVFDGSAPTNNGRSPFDGIA